jgi:Divergent InlB B-repeat domain
VASQPAGLNCTAACNAEFARDTVVTLTATPGAGQTFVGWTGACTGAASTCVVTMDAARIASVPDVTAQFAPITSQATYTFSLTIAGSGSVVSQPAGISCTASCNADFAADTTLTLTATPAAGQSFTGWTGACTGTALTCSFRVDANKSAGAGFATALAPGWQPQALVSPAGTFQHGFPRSVMAADGSVMATWLQQIDDNSQVLAYAVWSRVYRPGTGWGAAAEVIRTGPSVRKEGYQLAMNANGRGVLTWSELRSGTTVYDISAMPFDLGAGWGARSAINSQTSDVSNLSAGVDDNGNAVVTWLQAKPAGLPAGRGVWANRYTGGTWGTAQVLNPNLAEGAINPQVAVMPSGDAIAVWRGFGNGGRGLWTSKYTAGGAWGAPVNTVAPTGNYYDVGNNPAIVANGSSGATLVWWQLDLVSNVFQRSLKALNYSAGAWSATPADVSTLRVGIPRSDENEVRPVLATNAQNQVAVGWIWSDQPQTLWVNRSVANGTWETQQAANGADAGDLSGFNLGIHTGGHVTASWYNSRSSNIITSRLTQGAGWSQPQTMVDYDNTKGLLAAGALGTNARGDAVLVYQMNPDVLRQGSQVFSRYFVANP